ncbi:esterase [Oryzomicrobium terrae]|uniref:Esterase n=1 Tax=Oryzomicrobium terrae TaxID=1735038 RepID=A0A5C1ECF1_9RHOO|nr:esterase [Oryzomicrobium terrae]
MLPLLIYLHGFRSSPQSWKARLLGEAMAARGLADAFVCPLLPDRPAEAIALAEELIRQARAAGRPVVLAGSSLGGYYATWLAEQHDLRAALINPAVAAPQSLATYLGPQTNMYSGEVFVFTTDHIAELEALHVPHITPSRYLLLVETGDEVLDYRQAVARYAGADQRVFPGGDHSFTRFPEIIPQLLEFAGIVDSHDAGGTPARKV